MVDTKELINLTSLLDFSNKLTQNLSEDFIINSTLLTIIGKLSICGISCLKLIQETEVNSYRKGKFNCSTVYSENIIIDESITYKFELGEKLVGNNITETEKQYVKLIISIASTALENFYNFEKLQFQKIQAERKSQLLETLFEISRSFSDFTSEEKIVKALAFNIMGQLTTNRFAVIRLNGKNPILKNSLGISDESLLEIIPKFKKAKLDTDLSIELNEIIKIVSPMNFSGNTEGYLLIGPKMFGNYDEQDFSFVSSLASTAISALENERLIQEEIEKKRFETEMTLAKDIQNRLFPINSLDTKEFSYYGMTLPSSEVGGDYFDYVKISDSKYLFVIADVTGKGMPAALIMSNIQATIQSLAPLEPTLKSLVNTVNKIVYNNTGSDMFITAFFCLLDTEKSELEYVNAGHFYPLLFNENRLEELKIGGVILGFLPSPLEYESAIVPFTDSLVLYTDGLNEATNQGGDELGMEGVRRIVSEAIKFSPKEATEYILKQVRNYTKSEELADDISLVVLKKK